MKVVYIPEQYFNFSMLLWHDMYFRQSGTYLYNHLPHIPVLNSLPNDKILDWSNFKAFADNKINVVKKLKLALGTVENIVGKGENAGYQHFLLFPQCFQKAPFSGSLKVGIVW